MLSPIFSDPHLVSALGQRFDAAKPYKHVVIDNVLEPAFAEALANHFPALEQMKVTYKGINEKKSEHSDFQVLPSQFHQLKEALFDPLFVQAAEAITGLKNLQVINDRYGYGLHQGGNGSFLDVHIDYNLHPIRKKQRRLNLLIFLNKEWQESWGGLLQLWNADATQCITTISPLFNRCVLFECTDFSYHGYNQISCPPAVTRKSFYTYFFSEPVAKLHFHDTIFKPLPEYTRWKKLVVSNKELFKNSIKRFAYKTGLIKLLK